MTQLSISNASPTSSLRQAGPSRSEAPIARVALVDDDDLFRESLGMNLSDEGFAVVPFDRGHAALDYFADGGEADLILLDWRMPRMDGIETLRQLRARNIDIPVIFLTVLSDQIYEETALTGGAVDFVEKSRSLPILLKRMQLIVQGRKPVIEEPAAAAAAAAAGPAAAAAQPVLPGQMFRRGALELKLEGSRAFWNSTRIDLTLTEFNIVKVMATRAGEDVSYRDIYDLVHGKDFVAGYGPAGYRANVRAFIKRIRHKFRSVDSTFDEIENYPGFGYRWSDRSPGEMLTAR
jgi:two-component system response regulator ChvI